MRNRYMRTCISLLVSVAVVAGPTGATYAQGYDEGVARTVTGPDAEGGRFEAPQTSEPPRQSQYQAPWQPRPSGQFACDLATDRARGMAMDTVAELPGGGVIKAADDFVLGPLQAAAQAPGSDGDEPLPSERVAAFVLALSQAGAQLVFPEIGLVVQGGQVLIGGTSYAIDSMVAGAREQETMAMLTGYGGPLGSLGNVGAQVPFIPFLQRQERYRGLTPENLGQYIRNPDELTAALGQWEAGTRDVVGRDNQRVISDMLAPRLYNMWLAQRVEYVISQANRALTPAVRAALAQTRQEQAACTAPRPAVASAGQRGLYSDVVDSPVTFEWDTKVRIFSIECFGGAQYAMYNDHYSLNGRYVGFDRREYDRVRAPLVASGAPFCGAWETRRETTGRGG